MDDTSHGAPSSNLLQPDLLKKVAQDDVESIPDELNGPERFVLSSIRAARQRSDFSAMCAFVYSEATCSDTTDLGFDPIYHMQQGETEISGSIITTNQDAINGMKKGCDDPTLNGIIGELKKIGWGGRYTVIWDPKHFVATIYPSGISSLDICTQAKIDLRDTDLSREDVKSALDLTYDENLKNPSAHTAKLWVELRLIKRAEDELERHIKGQLAMFFLGQNRPIKIFPQTNTSAGRSDLIFSQKQSGGGLRIVGILELKVLRGKKLENWKNAKDGLSQVYSYSKEMNGIFAILALYDVADPPSNDVNELLSGQDDKHIDAVLAIRYPIFNSPKAWRNSTVNS